MHNCLKNIDYVIDVRVSHTWMPPREHVDHAHTCEEHRLTLSYAVV